jgi:hypothetical protein
MTSYTIINIKFSKSQSPAERGKILKVAQFEGYVDTRPQNINNEINNIDIKTPYLCLSEAMFLESQIESTNGEPFYLINAEQNLGLFRVRPFIWSVDEKATAAIWDGDTSLYPKANGKVRSLSFKVERAYGVLSELFL